MKHVRYRWFQEQLRLGRNGTLLCNATVIEGSFHDGIAPRRFLNISSKDWKWPSVYQLEPISCWAAWRLVNCTFDVPQRVQYKLCTTVHRCLENEAPQYLVDCCTPVSDIASRQHQLFVPRRRRLMFGRRTFSIAGPMTWNSLLDSLRDPVRSSNCFRRDRKTCPISSYTAH